MSNSKDAVNTSYEKRLNFTATGIFILWIITFSIGIFSLIDRFLLFNYWFIAYTNPLFYIVFIIGCLTSKTVSFSIINLIKNRQWIKPSNFIKSILIQLVTVTIASILTIIFYEANNFSGFFSLFTSFTVLFSTGYIIFCLYYYRYDLPKDQDIRNQNLKGAF